MVVLDRGTILALTSEVDRLRARVAELEALLAVAAEEIRYARTATYTKSEIEPGVFRYVFANKEP